MKEKVILPKVMSQLIRIALADLAKVEQKPDTFVVNMNDFYAPQDDGPCMVCFAGAVMACTLWQRKFDETELMWPENFTGNSQQLWALDSLRQGAVWEAAFVDLRLEHAKDKTDKFRSFNREITPYKHNPEAFRRDMEKLASDLEAAGL